VVLLQFICDAELDSTAGRPTLVCACGDSECESSGNMNENSLDAARATLHQALLAGTLSKC